LTPPSFFFWSLFLAVLLVFLATVERPRFLPLDDEALLLPRQVRDRDLGLALRLRLRDVVRLAALLRRLAFFWLDASLALERLSFDLERCLPVLERCSLALERLSLALERSPSVTATASAEGAADGSVADATAGLVGTVDVWSDPPSVTDCCCGGCCDCCCCVCCVRSEEVGDVTVFFEVACFFTLASEALVDGLPRLATDVDLALLAPFDRPLARPVERERLAAAAVFAAFFSVPLTVFDAARALAVFVSRLRGDLERARLQRSVEDDARLVLPALTERPLDLAADFRAVTRAHFFWTGEARALDEGRFVDADLGRPAGEQLRAAAARFDVTLRALLFDEREPEDAADVLRHGAMMSDARFNDRCSQTQCMLVIFFAINRVINCLLAQL